ncbi:hypothetical protein C0991_000288 [Blastosporella zonata]|nr:hypothetical protein C0991_000288 [Blastosporella zonata]
MMDKDTDLRLQESERKVTKPRLMSIMSTSSRYSAWETIQARRMAEKVASHSYGGMKDPTALGFVFDPFGSDIDSSPPAQSVKHCLGHPRRQPNVNAYPAVGDTRSQPSLVKSNKSSTTRNLPIAKAPSTYIMPHIIGEDDPCNPFSVALYYAGDVYARSIMTPQGKIVAPIPRHSTTAALVAFEIAAMQLDEDIEFVFNNSIVVSMSSHSSSSANLVYIQSPADVGFSCLYR